MRGTRTDSRRATFGLSWRHFQQEEEKTMSVGEAEIVVNATCLPKVDASAVRRRARSICHNRFAF